MSNHKLDYYTIYNVVLFFLLCFNLYQLLLATSLLPPILGLYTKHAWSLINRNERPYVLCPDLHSLNHWSLNVASNVCMRVESGNKKLCSLVSCVPCPVVSQQSPVALVSAWKGLSPQQVDRSITPLVRLHLVSTWQSTLDTVHTGSKQGALHNISPYSIYPWHIGDISTSHLWIWSWQIHSIFLKTM